MQGGWASTCLAGMKPWILSPAQSKPGLVTQPVSPVLWRCRRKGQKFKSTVSDTTKSRKTTWWGGMKLKERKRGREDKGEKREARETDRH